MVRYNSLLLSVGGNIGDTAEQFGRLCRLLEERVGSVTAISPYYKTAPWGFASDHAFTNAAAEVLTTLAPLEILDATQEIERLLGRTRKSEKGVYHDRTIDIDLIAYNDMVISTERLTLPHPLMAQRRFVLQPLCDIAPDWVHPLLHRSVRQLLEECADKTEALLIRNPMIEKKTTNLSVDSQSQIET